MPGDAGGYFAFLWLAPFCAAGVIVALVAVWPFRRKPSVRSLIGFLGLVAWLLAVNSLELLCGSAVWSEIFAKAEYLAFVLFPVAWLSFSLRYSGQVRWVRPTNLWTGIGVSMILWAFVLTNEWHHLVWTRVWHPTVAGLLTFRAEHGPLFRVLQGYVVLLLAAGAVALVSTLSGSLKVYRRQSWWMVAGLAFPLVTNAIYAFHLVPFLVKDFTPIGFALSGVFFAIGILRLKIFQLMPIPRSTVLEALDTGVIVLSSEHLILDWNRRAVEFLGTVPEKIGVAAESVPLLARALVCEPYVPLVAGTRVLRVRLQALQNRHAVSGVLVLLEDETEAAELREDRARILQKLIDKDKLARVGQLTAGIAHEINNPLAYVFSELRILKRLIATPERQSEAAFGECLSALDDGLKRIDSVVHNLLDYSRMDPSHHGFEEYNLHDGIKTTLELSRSGAGPDWEIRLDLEPVPRLLSLPNEINQVILILLTNAFQAIQSETPSESEVPWISIKTYCEDSWAVCEIANSGPAIPRELTERIFEPFYTAKPRGVGTGLGLGIAREIIEGHHQGRLELKSSDPVVFRFFLPGV